MNQKQKRHPVEGGAVLLGGVNCTPFSENTPSPQPATVHQVRALHLISTRHVKPSMALTLAALCYGEAR